jgi:sec-independent protein translocase protein TatC
MVDDPDGDAAPTGDGSAAHDADADADAETAHSDGRGERADGDRVANGTDGADAADDAAPDPDDLPRDRPVPDATGPADAGPDADTGPGLATDGEGSTAGPFDAEAPVADDGTGTGTGTGAGTGSAPDYAPEYDGYDPDDDWDPDDGWADGPEGDVEMPLTEHIQEMVRRLAVVFAFGGVVTLILFPGADLANASLGTDLLSATEVINHLWAKHIPGTIENPGRRPRLYGPLELVLTELKVAGLGGLVVGLPVLVYETYLFMRPGLYRTERRYYLAAVPTSVVLATVGVAFAHFVVLPAIFAYFTSYTEGTAVVAFGLAETFNLILILMGYMAIVFQIPLFILLAIMMDLITAQWLRDRRLLFWGGFVGISFVATPDPTGMAPIIVGATMIVLFEGTLFGIKQTDALRRRTAE